MKKKVVNGIGAVLCALVVLVGCFCNDSYCGSTDYTVDLLTLDLVGETYSGSLPEAVDGYKYYAIFQRVSNGAYYLFCDNDKLVIVNAPVYPAMSYNEYDAVYISTSGGVTWDAYNYGALIFGNPDSSGLYQIYSKYCGGVGNVYYNDVVIFNPSNMNGEVVDVSLGYLKGLSYDIAYEMGALYNYDEKSRTDRFTFDKLTTTDLDLTSGNYSIRHYIRPVLVTGYEDEDIVEKGERYLMGTYDASGGEFRYKRADYETKLEEYGYDGLDFFDSLLGRFYLEWHYFQIVNNDTGEVGNYVVMRPKNADENEFGTESVAYTVDENDEVDTENGYGETIVDKDMAGGETIDEAFENGEEEDLDFGDLDGIDEFTKALKSFTKSIGKVSNAFGKLLGALPQWVVNVLGVSIGLSVLLFLIKVLRG